MAQDIPINAKEALECIRSSMSNIELMERFKISTKGYADLLKQLFRKKLITEEDLARRGITFTIVPKPEDVPTPDPPPTLFAPPPPPNDSEFLDTAALTDLLSFKSPDGPPLDTPEEPAEIGSPEDEAESNPRKVKHSLGDLFKKNV